MIIDGKKVAQAIEEGIKQEIQTLRGRAPGLVMILVGEHPASQGYVTRKRERCLYVGIRSIVKTFSAKITEEQLLQEIELCNTDPTIDGILVQLPLPSHINIKKVTTTINPDKDVDGFHPLNMGKLLLGDFTGFLPCTPLGIHTLLKYYKVPLFGKEVVVIGRSNIVGKPLAVMLMQNRADCSATVTVLHRDSKNIPDHTRRADVLIVAAGKPNLVTLPMVKEGAVVIDVGINKLDDQQGSRIVGDADFEGLKNKCSLITPVPGGVGPMTVAMLLSNTLKSFKNRLEGANKR